MKLEIGKTYVTRDGRKVRIVCTDRESKMFPVVGLVKTDAAEMPVLYTTDGKMTVSGRENDYDIIKEYSPWDDVEVDTPVIVWDDCYEHIKRKRYFAKYEDGTVYAFSSGSDSWSADNEESLTAWDNARLATKDRK